MLLLESLHLCVFALIFPFEECGWRTQAMWLPHHHSSTLGILRTVYTHTCMNKTLYVSSQATHCIKIPPHTCITSKFHKHWNKHHVLYFYSLTISDPFPKGPRVVQPQNNIYFSYWFTYSTPKYGNCFTFNTLDNVANDDDVPRQATLTGRDNGKTRFVTRHP